MSNLFGRATQTLVLHSEVRRAYEAVDRELKVVADIQRSLLPTELPDVPTVAETLPGFAASGWFALVAPRGTPAAIVNKVSHDLRVVVALPDVKERFDALSVSTRSMSPQELSDFIRSEGELWKPVIKQAGLGAS